MLDYWKNLFNFFTKVKKLSRLTFQEAFSKKNIKALKKPSSQRREMF